MDLENLTYLLLCARLGKSDWNWSEVWVGRVGRIEVGEVF